MNGLLSGDYSDASSTESRLDRARKITSIQAPGAAAIVMDSYMVCHRRLLSQHDFAYRHGSKEIRPVNPTNNPISLSNYQGKFNAVFLGGQATSHTFGDTLKPYNGEDTSSFSDIRKKRYFLLHGYDFSKAFSVLDPSK